MIRDPGDRPSTREHLHALNDPGAGILVIRPLPYPDSPLNLTFSVLEALGKTLPSTASATLPSRPWELAVSWAAGTSCGTWWPTAPTPCALSWPGSCGTWPAARPRPAQALADRRRRYPRPPLGNGQLRSPALPGDHRRPRVAAHDCPFARPAPAPAGPLIPDDLPANNFMTFRAACARHQDPAAMARLDQLWSRTFHDARQWVSQARYARAGDPFCRPAKLALAHLKLAARTYAAATGGEALTVLRATQAGLLREDCCCTTSPGLVTPAWATASPTVTATVNRAITTAGAAAATLYLLFPYDRRNAEPHCAPRRADPRRHRQLQCHRHHRRRPPARPPPRPPRPARPPGLPPHPGARHLPSRSSTTPGPAPTPASWPPARWRPPAPPRPARRR